ncbi:hypothetical protein Tco_0860009 [Tanacetum coccineum]|uniref:Uncharacterized protein n=1 Tax=Tanacetum coccineum TaxID=301880 RepID=A0ABQ5BGQ6_9ASTR
MIKNGENGSFLVVFPLVRLVSSLQGFNSPGIHFLNFFNDPRIIGEQRIAALWVLERRDVVQVRMKIQRFDVLDGSGFATDYGCRGCYSKGEACDFILGQEKR